jgi:hypothetical protein
MTHRFSRYQLRSILTAVLVWSISGCGGPSHDIVGKWRTSTDPNAVVWEFASNGRVTIGSNRGRYSFGSSGRIKIEMPSGISVYQATISRDYMSFEDSSGSRIEFTRTK